MVARTKDTGHSREQACSRLSAQPALDRTWNRVWQSGQSGAVLSMQSTCGFLHELQCYGHRAGDPECPYTETGDIQLELQRRVCEGWNGEE